MSLGVKSEYSRGFLRILGIFLVSNNILIIFEMKQLVFLALEIPNIAKNIKTIQNKIKIHEYSQKFPAFSSIFIVAF